MSDDFGKDPQKMLDWEKELSEQSDFVKEAIKPFLTEKMTYVSDLYNALSKDEVFVGDLKPVVEKLMPLGIEGTIFSDRIDVYNDDFINEINKDHDEYFDENSRSEQLKSQIRNFKEESMSEKFNWENVEPLAQLYENYDLKGDCLKTFLAHKEIPCYFVVEPLDIDKKTSNIKFYMSTSDIADHKSQVYVASNIDFDTAKNIVENTVDHFSKSNNYGYIDIQKHIIKQLPASVEILGLHPDTPDRQLEKHFEEDFDDD